MATDVEPIREQLARWVPKTELADLDYLDGYDLFH